jgi:hypothetical protein
VSSILASELVHRGFDVVEPGLVRGLFLESRTVLRGEINLPILEQLVDAFEVDFVVTGEVETFQTARGAIEQATPSVDFGARLVDARDQRLVLTFDESRGGRDGELVLGVGRTYSLGRLVRGTLSSFVREIERGAPHEIVDTHLGRVTP